jgi:hypothetical protein
VNSATQTSRSVTGRLLLLPLLHHLGRNSGALGLIENLWQVWYNGEAAKSASGIPAQERGA